MRIDRILHSSNVQYWVLNILREQQSEGKTRDRLTIDEVAEVLTQPNACLYGVFEDSGELVGTGLLLFNRTLARWGGEMHDIVVHESCRKKGYGEALVKFLFDRAQQFANERQARLTLHWSCRPSRVAANNLYLKLGATLVAVAKEGEESGTNMYKMKFFPQPVIPWEEKIASSWKR